MRRRNPELWAEVLNEVNPFKRPLIDQVSCVRTLQLNTFSVLITGKQCVIEVLIIKLLQLAAKFIVHYAIENGSHRGCVINLKRTSEIFQSSEVFVTLVLLCIILLGLHS